MGRKLLRAPSILIKCTIRGRITMKYIMMLVNLLLIGSYRDTMVNKYN
jgi:hypothetical protein